MKSLGLYIHIPFCKQKCSYCDFYSKPACENSISEYVSALCAHIEKEASQYNDYEISTIFIGGGTPSLLSENDIEKLCKTIKKFLNVPPSVEFSIEANPGTLTKEKLESYRKNGINRLSIGLQSANESELKCLGRIHSVKEFEASFLLARRAGFDNINVDIMYSLPDQTIEKLTKTLDYVSSFEPEHISAYCLKLEKGTPLYSIEHTLNMPGEELEYQMYLHLCSYLEGKGYEQYEISNFAKQDKECRHNLIYWLSGDYIGFGPSAHSFFDSKRYFYEEDTQKYQNDALSVRNFPKKIYEEQSEIEHGSMEEYTMLRLRLSKGIDLFQFKSKFGIELEEAYPRLKDFYKDSYLVKENGCVHFTQKGFFVSNFILSSILF